MDIQPGIYASPEPHTAPSQYIRRLQIRKTKQIRITKTSPLQGDTGANVSATDH